MAGTLSVILWVLPSVAIGVGVGFYIGRCTYIGIERQIVQRERQTTLKALITLVQSTEQMTTDVDTHNSKLEDVERTVGDMKVTGELGEMQNLLLNEISAVVESNQQLEEDLVFARYRLEEQAQELDRTRVEARTDSLSGVANRKAFDEKLKFLLLEYKRQDEPFALILADIDHFKWINDTHGHSAGDRVVTHIGSVLNQYVRPGDQVARFGGDEFALLFPQTDPATAAQIADRIRLVVERHNFDVGPRGERAAVTFSMGMSSVKEGDNSKTILDRADQALYKSKQEGRNQLHCSAAENELVKIGS